MLSNNAFLPFVPENNESLGYNALIEWKNGAIPAKEMVKIRRKVQASQKSRFAFLGNTFSKHERLTFIFALFVLNIFSILPQIS